MYIQENTTSTQASTPELIKDSRRRTPHQMTYAPNPTQFLACASKQELHLDLKDAQLFIHLLEPIMQLRKSSTISTGFPGARNESIHVQIRVVMITASIVEKT